MLGNSLTTALLQKALDGTWQRQRAISNNIANHETPGYKSQRVSFEQDLQREVSKLQGSMKSVEDRRQGLNRIEALDIKEYTIRKTSERADGNNVNLDAENIDMAKVQIQYQYLTREMTDMFARLRYAISEGKK